MFWSKFLGLSVFVTLVVTPFWAYCQNLYSCFRCTEVKLVSLISKKVNETP